MTGSWEHGNEKRGGIQRGEFLDLLRDLLVQGTSLSTTIQRRNFLVNTEVFRTQPLLGDPWSRELRNYSLCCSAPFAAINIAYYRHRSPVLLHITTIHATLSQYQQTYRYRVRMFHTSRFNICISEGHGRVCFGDASFRFRS